MEQIIQTVIAGLALAFGLSLAALFLKFSRVETLMGIYQKEIDKAISSIEDIQTVIGRHKEDHLKQKDLDMILLKLAELKTEFQACRTMWREKK